MPRQTVITHIFLLLAKVGSDKMRSDPYKGVLLVQNALNNDASENNSV